MEPHIFSREYYSISFSHIKRDIVMREPFSEINNTI